MDERKKPILSVNNVTVERPRGLGERDLGLRNVSLELHEREILVCAGESGSGKSLLAQLISGVISPSDKVISGSIEFESEDILRLNRRRNLHLRRSRIGVLVKDAHSQLNPNQKVRQWLRESSRLTRSKGEGDWSDYFYAVGIVEPERILEMFPADLSSLMLKRLILMKTLMSGAGLLVCDEATAGLDRIAEAQFFELIASLRDDYGLSVVLAMKGLRGIKGVADRVAIFYEGGILECGPSSQILERPKYQYSKEFRACSPRITHLPGALPMISREAIAEAEKVVHENSTADIARKAAEGL
ncbi:ATP-binding cassette domain-containing protein [Verrucomicrobiales bacterium BCK34]|nr:ATP-binding cassette domain-containing protein [Verrucomicrobiales bacterium BCK34]